MGLSMKVNDIVVHPRLGIGRVLSIEKRDRAMVLFCENSECVVRIGKQKDLEILNKN